MKIKNTEIWLILDSRKPGGIETHVQQLAEGLKNQGEKVAVIFLTHFGEHPLRTALKQSGIRTISLDGRFITLWKALRNSRPRILHTHGYKAGIFGRFAAGLCKTPVISTYHTGEIASGKLELYHWLDRQSARIASMIFAVSPQIAERLPVAAHVVDNFIDTTNVETSIGNEIAFVGRLSTEKGPDYFLQLASRFPQQIFHIYGDGPEYSALRPAASENVIFHGQQNDMTLIWPRIGLLVMPSRHEGLPMAALEAMARGIPVLASRVGALDQLIDSNINGWLAAAGNINELDLALREWIAMPMQGRLDYKQAARNKIQQRFTAAIAIPELINCYRQIAI